MAHARDGGPGGAHSRWRASDGHPSFGSTRPRLDDPSKSAGTRFIGTQSHPPLCLCASCTRRVMVDLDEQLYEPELKSRSHEQTKAARARPLQVGECKIFYADRAISTIIARADRIKADQEKNDKNENVLTLRRLHLWLL